MKVSSLHRTSLLPSCLRRTPLLLSLPLALAAQEPAVRCLPSAVRPIEPWPQQVGRERWLCCRAIDAISGQPIAGAELFLVAESSTPVGGRFEYVRKVRSDRGGWLALPYGERDPGWAMLMAPGYGPSSCGSGVPGVVWPLAPAVDVPLQLRDWLDRPVPGARVGLCLGCGHTPDVANATADARGIAVVRGVDPHNDIADFYPQHAGLGIDHHGGVDWVPGAPPAIVRASYAEPVRGKVVGADGKPAAGAFVGTKGKHRGPWTQADGDGNFALDGAEPGADLFVVLPAAPRHEYLFERPWQQPAVLQLPPADASDCQCIDLPQPAGEQGVLQLRLVDGDGAPLAGVGLQLVGPLPLRHRFADTTDADGRGDCTLFAGSYEVRCDELRFEPLLGTVRVEAAATASPRLQARLLPTVRLDAEPGCKVLLLRSIETAGP